MSEDNTENVRVDYPNDHRKIPETYDDLYTDRNGNLKSEYRAPETEEEIEAHIEAMDELREKHSTN